MTPGSSPRKPWPVSAMPTRTWSGRFPAAPFGEEMSDAGASEAAFVATDASRRYAAACVEAIAAARASLHDAEERLGRMDAIADDGDHGRGMVRGVDAATAAAATPLGDGAGAGDVLAAAGDAWADKAGGTSGILWGAGLRAFGETVGNSTGSDGASLAAGCQRSQTGSCSWAKPKSVTRRWWTPFCPSSPPLAVKQPRAWRLCRPGKRRHGNPPQQRKPLPISCPSRAAPASWPKRAWARPIPEPPRWPWSSP